MTVKISELSTDVTVQTLVNSGGLLPVVSSNTTTGNLYTYAVSLSNIKSAISSGDFTIYGNVTVNGQLIAPNQTTVTLTSVSSTNNFVDIQTDSNLVYPNVSANNKSVGIRLFYFASNTGNSAALVRETTTGYLTWYGANIGNSASVLSANSILGTIQAGELVISNATVSSNTSTGALRVTGGGAVIGDFNVGGSANIASNISGNILSIGDVIASRSVTVPVATVSTYATVDRLIVNTTSTLTGNISVLSDIIPFTNLSSSLGNASNYFGNLYVGNATVTNFALQSNLTPVSNVSSTIGNSTNYYNALYINNINLATNTIPTGNNLSWLGNSTNRFLNVFANAINASGNITTLSNVTAAGVTSNANISAGNVLVSGLVSLSSITKTGTNGVGNIGSSTSYFNTAFVKATSAQYADLAEIYESDADYTPGTVVIFGGSKEITVTDQYADTRVAGAISTDPAYLMNDQGAGLPLALRGKVPVKVTGAVAKGDLLVTSLVPGCATVADGYYSPNAVFAKSLEDSDNTGEHIIWAMIL